MALTKNTLLALVNIPKIIANLPETVVYHLKRMKMNVIYTAILVLLIGCNQKQKQNDTLNKRITEHQPKSSLNTKNVEPTQAQDRVFQFLGLNAMGTEYKITLTLKKNKEFLYSKVDDQQCYVNRNVALGQWEQKGQNIILKVNDEFLPKITLKEQLLKKDTLTIFFRKMDDCGLLKKVIDHPCYSGKDQRNHYYGERVLHFYDKNNKKIEIEGLQNSEKITIPMNKGIAKIDFYFPNDQSPNSTKASVKVSENTGQIHISNLSRSFQTNFVGYTFLLKKKYILMSGEHDNVKLQQIR